MSHEDIPQLAGQGYVEPGERVFRVIVTASAPYRNDRRLDYANYRVECCLHDQWNRYFRCFLDYDPNELHLLTLVVRLARGFEPERQGACRLLFRAGVQCRLARVVAGDDGHVFVKAFAADVQHAETIPAVVHSIFAETLRLLNDEALRTALDAGGATIDGEPDRSW